MERKKKCEQKWTKMVWDYCIWKIFHHSMNWICFQFILLFNSKSANWLQTSSFWKFAKWREIEKNSHHRIKTDRIKKQCFIFYLIRKHRKKWQLHSNQTLKKKKKTKQILEIEIQSSNHFIQFNTSYSQYKFVFFIFFFFFVTIHNSVFEQPKKKLVHLPTLNLKERMLLIIQLPIASLPLS